MTKRPIDGPSRRIIFHPFPAIGWKSMIWQAIKGPILIADGFQSYQSWGMNGPQKMGIFILSYFHRRSDSAGDFQSYQSWGMNGPQNTAIFILPYFHRRSDSAGGFQSYQSWGMNGPQKMGIFILPYFHRRSDSAADFQSYQSCGMNDKDCQGLSFGQNSNRGQSWGTIGPKTTNILILSHFHRGSTLHRIDQSMTKKVTDLQKDGRKKT